MVQRKDPNKLGIQADSKDDVKSDKWLLALKPSSSQHQDIQDKGGTELKKKKEIKMSRSIKLLDLENLESVPTRRAKSRFNKPPTSASTAAANQQKPFQSNKRDPSPNYMRPTSSFDAKKELSQVNPHGYLASCSRKSLSPKPTGRSSFCKSPSQGHSSARNSYPNNMSSSGVRSSHCKRLSEANSNHKSPSPNSSGRNTTQNSSTPSPDGRYFNSLSFSPNLRGRYSNTKLCSASDCKPVKTLTKTPSLKPVRTLTKTPSSLKGGAELKKQMKKSRSIKLLALATFEPSSAEKTDSSFDESPGTISSVAVTPVNEHLLMTPDLLPNYMKPTSSSDAKKEQSEVSTKGSKTSPSRSPNKSSLIRRKPSSASGYKRERTLAKTSSLKPVRTLTKTSSLKLQRSSIKNTPDIVSFSSLTAGRATCSSTLKDSKFPTFLTLSPGATESEGTSAMKVCPYTYCSLNGHHHKQLPLLKPFLSARRCQLKRQKSLRMKNLSPLQNKPPGKSKKDVKRDVVAFYEDPTAEAADLAPAVKPPAIKEDGIDFFVEIYALPSKDTAMPMGRSIQDGNDEATTDCAVNSNIPVGITSSFIYGSGIETEDYDGNVQESMLNELSYSDISFEDNIDQNTDLDAGLDIQTCQQDQFIQIAYTHYNSSLVIAEPGNKYCIGKDLEEESTRDTELEESSLELTDMNWEGNSAPPCDESDFMTLHVTEFKRPMLEEELASKTDESINKDTEEFPLEGLAQQQIHTEDTESFTMEYSYDDSGTDVEDTSSERGIPINFSSGSSGISNFSDQILFSSTNHKKPATITEEVDGIPKPDKAFNSVVYSASVENQLDALTGPSDEKNEVPESENLLQELILITEVIGEAPVNEQESSLASTNNFVRVDAGDDAEGKEQAEDTTELDVNGGKSSHAENSIGEGETTQVEDKADSDATEKINSEANITSSKRDEKFFNRGNNFNQLPMTSVNLKRTIRCRRPIDEQEEPRKFNPREPQFLDIEPEPEPEQVDLRHQMMDGRKNAEEWMLDYALQQAVTKLAPARKRKVSLLVEAFEAVIPPPKCETRLPNTSAAFAHARSIQACN